MPAALTTPRTRLRLESLEDRCTPSYTITDLGTLGGNQSQAFGISKPGQAVGSSLLSDNQTNRAFRYSNGTMADIGTLGGQTSEGFAINTLGWVTGTSALASGKSHAFLFDGSTMQDLGTLGGNSSTGFAINNAGHVAGQSAKDNGTEHAFLFKNGTIRDLGSLGGPNSTATGINSFGRVVGYAQKPNGDNHAFFHSGVLRARDLGTLGGPNSYAYDINDTGEIVGCSDTAQGEVHVFLVTQGQMTDLGIPSACNWMALNNHGDFVGSMPSSVPILYKDGVVTNVNDLLPPSSGWVVTEARDINDAGQIVGYGGYLGETHAFLLTPSRGEAAPTPRIKLGWLALITADVDNAGPFARHSRCAAAPVFSHATAE